MGVYRTDSALLDPGQFYEKGMGAVGEHCEDCFRVADTLGIRQSDPRVRRYAARWQSHWDCRMLADLPESVAGKQRKGMRVQHVTDGPAVPATLFSRAVLGFLAAPASVGSGWSAFAWPRPLTAAFNWSIDDGTKSSTTVDLSVVARPHTAMKGYQSLLKSFVQVVVFLFAAFGGFLKKVAPPDQVGASYPVGVASFLVLILLMIISTVRRRAPPKFVSKGWILAGSALFILAIPTVFIYPYLVGTPNCALGLQLYKR